MEFIQGQTTFVPRRFGGEEGWKDLGLILHFIGQTRGCFTGRDFVCVVSGFMSALPRGDVPATDLPWDQRCRAQTSAASDFAKVSVLSLPSTMRVVYTPPQAFGPNN